MDGCIFVVDEPDGDIAVGGLYVDAPQALGGNTGVLYVHLFIHIFVEPNVFRSLPLAPLGEKAALGLVVAKVDLHLGFLILVVFAVGVLAVVIVVVVDVDLHLAVVAVPAHAALAQRDVPQGLLGGGHGLPGLFHGVVENVFHLLGVEGEFGQLFLGGQAFEIVYQLVHVSQVVQRLLEGFAFRHTGGGHVQIAVVKVVGQLFNELGLGGAVRGGGQIIGHCVDKSLFHLIHGYSSSMAIRAFSSSRVFSHSRMFSSHRRRPASVMA